MNRKAIELAISTLIIIILGIAVLIGLIYALTSGFKKFNSSTEPFTDTTQSTAIKTACEQACENQDQLTYCCQNYTVGEFKDIKCSDSRLGVQCQPDFDCESVGCD
jgi:uncharacterized protein YpmB